MVVDVDVVMGTLCVLGWFDGALSGLVVGGLVVIVDVYVRVYFFEFGFMVADFDLFGLVEVMTSSGGVIEVRCVQSFGGILVVDNDLCVNVARDGSVINVFGLFVHDLLVGSTMFGLDVGEVVWVVQDDVGVYCLLLCVKGLLGLIGVTTFCDGLSALLQIFQRAGGSWLVWWVMYKVVFDAIYDAFVDARTGAVLQCVNMVK